MKLSGRGAYALRALLVLARDHQEDDSVVRIQEISEKQNIPKRFLEQILHDLRSAGIVESKRGVAGGYRLRKPPSQVRLSQIVRHIEGPLAPVGCVSENYYEKCSCPNESACAIRSVMKDVRDAIVDILDDVTLADLCERARQLEQHPIQPLDFSI